MDMDTNVDLDVDTNKCRLTTETEPRRQPG